jgi:hypothetical protein
MIFFDQKPAEHEVLSIRELVQKLLVRIELVVFADKSHGQRQETLEDVPVELGFSA